MGLQAVTPLLRPIPRPSAAGKEKTLKWSKFFQSTKRTSRAFASLSIQWLANEDTWRLLKRLHEGVKRRGRKIDGSYDDIVLMAFAHETV